MRYRADIDGLRAVAVLPILLFHAGVQAISGGFIGVDIFFVISGFLITSIITHEMADGTFGIAEFYRRRVVRIFPALFVMLAVVGVACCFLLLPGELRQFGRSAAAAAGFVSNVYFWKTTSYFDVSADSKVLLHTWSLGVEEQFYLFYPLLLLIVRRFLPNRLVLVLILIGAASLALAGLLSWFVPGGAAAFYLLPSRAWELMLGGLVALGAIPPATRAWLRNGLALLGVVLIVIGLVVIRPDSPFPAPWALLPCIGAALLIGYGETAITAPLLVNPISKAIGQLSYSLYLWHWPIIVLWRLQFGMELSARDTVILVALSFIAAILSRRFVERPFLTRFRAGRVTPKLVAGGVALGVVVASMLIVAELASSIRRLEPRIARIASYGDYAESPEWAYQYRKGYCFPGEGGGRYNARRCLVLSDTKRNVIVLGDSHAAQYWRAIALALPGANVMQATASGCRPTVAFAGEARCTEMVRNVLGPVLATRRIDTVILAGRWRLSDVPAMAATIDRIRAAGSRVVVIGPTAEYDSEFPSLLARAMLQGDLKSLDRRRDGDRKVVDERLGAIVRAAKVPYVSALSIECPDGACRLTVPPDDIPMVFDYGHLTLAGARYVIGQARLGAD